MFGLILKDYTNSGVILNSDHPSINLNQYGTTSCNRYINYIDIDPIQSTSTPILFIKPTSFYVGNTGFVLSSDESEFEKIRICCDSSGDVSWAIYTDITDIDNNTFGLNLFNSDGRLTFSSNFNNYIKVRRSMFFNYALEDDYLVDDADDYILFESAKFNFKKVGTTDTLSVIGVKRIDDTTINFGMFAYYTGSSSGTSGAESSSFRLPMYVFIIENQI
jgi:hypothetical protein